MDYIGNTETPFPIYVNGGAQSMAFVKPVSTERGQMYAVCSAEDAQVLATFPTRDAALFAVIQNNMHPMTVH